MWDLHESRVRPLVWNFMYDNYLRMDLPAGTSIIGIADGALIVCTTEDVGILGLKINESLSWACIDWIRGLKKALQMIEALLTMDRRSFQYPKIVFGEHEVVWKKSIMYLGVHLDRIPNIGVFKKAKRRLVASVVQV